MENNKAAETKKQKRNFLVNTKGKPLPGASDWFSEYLESLNKGQ